MEPPQIVSFIGNVFGHVYHVVIVTPLGPVILRGLHHTLRGCLAFTQWIDRAIPYAVACIGR